MDRQRSESRIAEVIASMSADIVGLQELDLGRSRSSRADQAALIATQLGWKYHFHPAMRSGDEQYGNAIVSRFPIALKRADEMPGLAPWYCREKRIAIWMQAETDLGSVQHPHVNALQVAFSGTVASGPSDPRRACES
jgi:endonuclease/exonuclease/phosphatase family metal-dependent hydrolase